eukprot:1433390-Pleurochrysis_carterae.AAC.1
MRTGSWPCQDAVHFDVLGAHRAGEPDATPTSTRGARPALSSSICSLDPATLPPLTEIRSREMA